MKKLLILALILGMASTADAALSLGGDINNNIYPNRWATVTVISDDTSNWTGYIGWDLEGGVTGVVATSNAGEDALVTPDPYGWVGWYEIEAADDSEPYDSVQPGVQFEISVYIDYPWEWIVNIDLYDSDWATILDSGYVYCVIPEPLTFTMLGLGGLFLLRRRK